MRLFASVCAALALTTLVVACKKKDTVIGSCDRRSTDTDQSVCVDAFEKVPVLSACDVAHGTTQPAGKAATTACVRTGAIAGCKDAEEMFWMFPSKNVKTVENVAYFCTGALLGVDGVELKGVTKTAPLTADQSAAAAAVPAMKPRIAPMLAMVEQIAKKLPAPSHRTMAPAAWVGEAILYAQLEDLASLGVTANVVHRAGGSGELPACARAIRKNDVTGITDVPATLRSCAEAKYLIVARNDSIKEPVATPGINTYTAGHATGDVLLFDLSNGKLIGEAPFSADSSRDVQTTNGSFDSDLAKDFDKQIDIARGAAEYEATAQKKKAP